jgi:hypothetical protein
MFWLVKKFWGLFGKVDLTLQTSCTFNTQDLIADVSGPYVGNVELTAHADAKKSRGNYGIVEITFI